MKKTFFSILAVVSLALIIPFTASSQIQGGVNHMQPEVETATSTACLAANPGRKWFLIQNNTAANIMINLQGSTLTGITPSANNEGIVIVPGGAYTSSPNYVTVTAVTCYQTSGGTVRTISVAEGTAF